MCNDANYSTTILVRLTRFNSNCDDTSSQHGRCCRRQLSGWFAFTLLIFFSILMIYFVILLMPESYTFNRKQIFINSFNEKMIAL